MLQALVSLIARPLGFVLPDDGASRSSSGSNGSLPGLPGLPIPLPALTDSYKPTHFRQYPDALKMVAYGEFRRAYDGDASDQRIVFTGVRHVVDSYIAQPWTAQDLELMTRFMSTHNAGKTPFPFPADLFAKFIKENNGYFPVKVEALPEGTVCYPHTPVYQITATGEYSRLVTYLETLLSMVWYPTTVATLSRRAHARIKAAFEASVDAEAMFLLDSRLHDFGFRGCTSVEQSVIGGAAHLLNFTGSDTMSAGFHVQFHLNKGQPVAESIPATEHSVMTSYLSEKDAIMTMIREYGAGVFACVMDSYDYERALNEILPSVAAYKNEKGGFMVLRPDSGDPVQAVLAALRAAERVFGVTRNKKGFKVPNGVGVIHGDGISLRVMDEILNAVLAEGFSAQMVAFGMGAGLLQKVNRDTLSFATKLCFVQYADGTTKNVMKSPKSDSGKASLPGVLAVRRNSAGVPVVYPAELVPSTENVLEVVYDNGPVYDRLSTATVDAATAYRPDGSSKRRQRGKSWPTFDELRTRVATQWNALMPRGNAVSAELQHLMDKTKEQQSLFTAQSLQTNTPLAA